MLRELLDVGWFGASGIQYFGLRVRSVLWCLSVGAKILVCWVGRQGVGGGVQRFGVMVSILIVLFEGLLLGRGISGCADLSVG